MRKDLDKVQVYPCAPMVPFELALSAYTWYMRQLFDSGFADIPFSYQLLQHSPSYLHCTILSRNATFIMNIWDWAGTHSDFDYEGLVLDNKFSIASNTADQTYPILFAKPHLQINTSFVNIFLAQFRMMAALGMNHAQNYRLDDQRFNSEQYFKDYNFEIKKENPFIEMVKAFAGNHTTMALAFTFLMTCPSGQMTKPIKEANVVQVFQSASMLYNTSYLHHDMKNSIPSADWTKI